MPAASQEQSRWAPGAGVTLVGGEIQPGALRESGRASYPAERRLVLCLTAHPARIIQKPSGLVSPPVGVAPLWTKLRGQRDKDRPEDTGHIAGHTGLWAHWPAM